MGKKRPRATKIMLIRHAEKPAKDGAPFGITSKGQRNKESLEVRGWQRAGALCNLFAPADNHFPNTSFTKPRFLFASKPLKHKGSRRPRQTITPLAEKLAIAINTDFERAEFKEMLGEAFSCRGVVLICWQREYISDIAAHILDNKKTVPSDWPEDRFDMVWVFDLQRSSGKYRFKQVPQKLLMGDRTVPIK